MSNIFRSTLLGGGILAIAGLPLLGSTIPIASYDMLNGEKHSFSYMDKSYNGSGDRTVALSPLAGGTGELTDGIVGVTDFTANLGRGGAYEWVGWALDSFVPGVAQDTNDTFATITFKFDDPAVLNKLSLFVNNFTNGGVSGVSVFGTATVDFSNDGTNFVNPVTYTTSALQRADQTARYIDIPLNEVAAYEYARVHLTHQSRNTTSDNWIFLAEASFDGSQQLTATPEPSSWLMAGLGVVGFAALRFHRRSSLRASTLRA